MTSIISVMLQITAVRLNIIRIRGFSDGILKVTRMAKKEINARTFIGAVVSIVLSLFVKLSIL